MRKEYELYITGFIISILLTLGAYFSVTGHLFADKLIWVLAVLAFVQAWTQLYFFLHLNQKSQRWNLALFMNNAAVIFILIAGSVWIMNNLKYHSAPVDTDQQIFENEAIQK